MTNQSIQVEYHEGLESLEKILSKVRRAGEFFAEGRVEVPMPRLEVDGVGVISFPVPEPQVRQLIEHAERAPYGRGEETILDESVRKVWQLPPAKVRFGGKSWAASFQSIVDQVAAGLGCAKATVTAELYKLLVYDQDAFFATHRDTEKVDGMFGTLVVVLPSAHRGGELVIRHAGREVAVDFSAAESSELAFAAFYADCQHEVRPIVEGNRVCLIYNLLQRRERKTGAPSPTAPLYDAEVAAAAKCLAEAMDAPDAPAKIVWLLEHQYSPDGLSFAGLKNADAARAKVLMQAAAQTGCAVHLGIVHIEEYGPAEPKYDGGYGYRRRSRWRSYDDEEVEEDASSDDFEVIEVSDGQQYIDQWVDAQDRRVDFGKLPLGEGELLPHGALDDEKPDKQRLTEATGNEGASFERSYHRAALVLWPREQFAGVLLQAGVGAALPHLTERIRAGDPAAAAIAEQIIEAWENPPSAWSHQSLAKESSRAEMLRLMTKLNDRALLERFIGGIVMREYDGSENEALAAGVRLVGPSAAAQLLAAIARENMPLFHRACVNLLSRVVSEFGEELTGEWLPALREVSSVMVGCLSQLQPPAEPYESANWQRVQKAKPVDATMVAHLLESLRALDASALRMKAAAAIVAGVSVFDPGKIIVPALTLLQRRERKAFLVDAAAELLWVHAAEFLLVRSERPPAPPIDWKLAATLSCKCEDCRELQKFANNPEAQVARFRVRQDRRQHLHGQIEHHGLDMTHVTERKGSPQTLVCTKTRRTYQRQCEQHRDDCASMGTLLDQMRPVPGGLSKLAARLAAAKNLKPQT
jgi:hypothetical protein